jgi:hypothetical protein
MKQGSGVQMKEIWTCAGNLNLGDGHIGVHHNILFLIVHEMPTMKSWLKSLSHNAN